MNVSELARSFGIPVVFNQKPNATTPTWDGQVLHAGFPAESTNPAALGWMYHEIAHHLIASPAARLLPNYGLGMDPGGGGKSLISPEHFRGDHEDQDEGAACLLNILLMVEGGFPIPEIRSHAEEYGVIEVGVDDFEILRLLNALGFHPERLFRSLQQVVKNPKELECVFTSFQSTLGPTPSTVTLPA